MKDPSGLAPESHEAHLLSPFAPHSIKLPFLALTLSPLADEELKAIFKKLDINNDGKVTKEEFESSLGNLGIKTSARTWKYVLKNDSTRSGDITFDEFRNFALFRCNELRKIFKEMDKDGSGHIGVAELEKGLAAVGVKASKSQTAKMHSNFDMNGDGKITFDEFRKITMLFPSTKVHAIFDHAASNYIAGYYSIPKSDGKDSSSPLCVFLSGGAAGLVSRTITAPADRLKVMLQAGEKGATLSGTVRDILKEGGARAFWRGNGTNVLKIMPESAAKFYCYEFLKSKIIQDVNDVKVHERLLAGSLAGMSAQTLIYPMEVVKTRLAISAPGTYASIPDCFSKIVQGEGAGALYKGLGASNIGIIPYAGVDLAVYGSIKDWWVRRNPNATPAWYETLSMGAFSSFVGQVVAYPLQLVRTKLQSSGLPGRPAYNGIGDVVSAVMKDEGLAGFYRGIGANFMKGIPAVAIGYLAYEKAKEILGQIV